MLEQLLLQLRRSGSGGGRRGRYGGYRLGRPAREIPVAAVLEAVAGLVSSTPEPAALPLAAPGPRAGLVSPAWARSAG
jgi:DNA-binding IscR family transcriptional regulator